MAKCFVPYGVFKVLKHTPWYVGRLCRFCTLRFFQGSQAVPGRMGGSPSFILYDILKVFKQVKHCHPHRSVLYSTTFPRFSSGMNFPSIWRWGFAPFQFIKVLKRGWPMSRLRHGFAPFQFLKVLKAEVMIFTNTALVLYPSNQSRFSNMQMDLRQILIGFVPYAILKVLKPMSSVMQKIIGFVPYGISRFSNWHKDHLFG